MTAPPRPVPPLSDVPAAGPPAPATVQAPPAGLWELMKADPQYAPEHLALEAVRQLGPQAARWTRRWRAEHPERAADEMAQFVIRRFRLHARLSGAVSGAAGLPGAVVDLGVLAWTQSRMVLHLAAAYGVDPTHPDRATDLLVLQQVHKAGETARLALGVAAGRERLGTALTQVAGGSRRRATGRLAVRLARMAGLKAVNRMLAKVVPFASIVLGAWANSAAVDELAARATALYRQPPPAPVPHQRPPV